MSRTALLGASLLFELLAAAGRAEHIHREVSPDGSEDFSTIQEAIDSVPNGFSDWAVIHIRAAHYVEAVQIPVGKRKLVLVGDGRDETVIEYDESYVDPRGRLRAVPVLTNRADDVVVRALSIRNLAGEPGGSGGKWDSALVNFGDRLILHDVLLRSDHDTLLCYGPPFLGLGHGHTYVRDSHIQGRGDFIAAFTSLFIENSVLETIRDRSHILFHQGVPDHPPELEDALVVKTSTFTGQSLDPEWPAGVTNLYDHGHVHLIENVFEYDLGANRPVAFFHDALQPLTAEVLHFGNTQSLSPQGPLIWDLYSVPGPGGTRVDLPVTENEHGEPIVAELTAAEAELITPSWLFQDWDPRTEEPLSDCEDGVDNDADGSADTGDLGCASLADFSELSDTIDCDNGVDDDGDGWIDFAGGDPGCRNSRSTLEGPQCQDGVDNDLQSGIDFDGGASVNGGVPLADPDPQCTAAWLNGEAAAPPSGGCGMGIELSVLMPLLARLRCGRLRHRG
jgi:hypothetical protein